ncbi:MAG: DNA-binding SARP family transcriptional activator, partial [Cyclobacteriaceae bacterium]
NISFETQEYNAINWTGDFSSTTGSTFCFPTYSGEKVNIIPQSPGYSFVPAELIFEGNNDAKVNLKSTKKNLFDGTIAYFPFDENMKDLSSNGVEAINHGIAFIEDFNREKVALLDGKNHAIFPQLSDFGMVNQSFTVSAWIKLKSVDEQDQIILSSAKNKYSEGLYMLIRAKKPYLAFYHNDLEGQTVLEVNKWYNIVWRYRKELQQQTIYVNGKLDAVANEHPSFKGGGELNFGYRKNPQGIEHFFDGRIDDLIFWNRALGDSEIRNVYEGNFEFVEEQNNVRIIWLAIIASVLILLAYVFRRRVFNAKSLSEEVQITVPEINTSRNAVFMFGGLKVLDRDGENITNEITPKLKELFVLLYLSTLKNKKGISSEDLSVGIWPDLSRESAINNRGVSTAKLRQILSKVDGVSLKYNNQFWTLEMDDQVYSDYNVFLDFIAKKVMNLAHLTEILKAGNFLPNVSKEWLDSYKFEVSNKIIDIFSPQLEKQWIEKNYDLLIEYCEIILTFDVVHETAIKYKIASLKNQKKHEQALKVYQGFANLYQQFYKEEFATQFNDFHP